MERQRLTRRDVLRIGVVGALSGIGLRVIETRIRSSEPTPPQPGQPLPPPQEQPPVPETILHEARARRMEELFTEYGSPCAGQDLGNFMFSLEQKYFVKLEVVGAIGFADTTLGKNITTPFNFGNVGNTDSCPTCRSMGSWQEGIEAVFHTVSAQNPYLAPHRELWQLSGGGKNKIDPSYQGSIYASSPPNAERPEGNWHYNATFFLARFHGYEVNAITSEIRALYDRYQHRLD